MSIALTVRLTLPEDLLKIPLQQNTRQDYSEIIFFLKLLCFWGSLCSGKHENLKLNKNKEPFNDIQQISPPGTCPRPVNLLNILLMHCYSLNYSDRNTEWTAQSDTALWSLWNMALS